ncbi:MAG: hypothetical protein V3V14_01910 [Saprospiraceae bacterium]
MRFLRDLILACLVFFSVGMCIAYYNEGSIQNIDWQTEIMYGIVVGLLFTLYRTFIAKKRKPN